MMVWLALVIILLVLYLPPRLLAGRWGDLSPVPQRTVADEDNAWVALSDLPPRIAAYEGDPLEGAESGRLADGAREWLAANAALLPELDAALARPDCVSPRWQALRSGECSAYGGLRHLIRLAAVASCSDAEQGDFDAALRRLERCVALSRAMMTCGETAIGTLVAIAIMAVALRAVRLIAAARPVWPDWPRWRQTIALMTDLPNCGEVLASCQEGEYSFMYAVAFDHGSVPRPLAPWLVRQLRWDRLLGDTILRDRRCSLRGHRARWTAVADWIGESVRPRNPARLRRLRREYHPVGLYNLLGEWWLDKGHDVSRLMPDSIDSVRARAGLNVTWIALRAYHDRHGTLPDELAELVDEDLLPALPIDPFSEQAFGYDPQSRIIWTAERDLRTVGRDLELPLTFAR